MSTRDAEPSRPTAGLMRNLKRSAERFANGLPSDGTFPSDALRATVHQVYALRVKELAGELKKAV